MKAVSEAMPTATLTQVLAPMADDYALIDEYKLLVHPRTAGHGPTLYQSGLPSTRRLELVSADPLRNGAIATRSVQEQIRVLFTLSPDRFQTIQRLHRRPHPDALRALRHHLQGVELRRADLADRIPD